MHSDVKKAEVSSFFWQQSLVNFTYIITMTRNVSKIMDFSYKYKKT